MYSAGKEIPFRCVFFSLPVYVFLGNSKVLVEMMNTMHALQMFDSGEYMVITVDMETYSYREAYKYLWRKCPNHFNIPYS